MSEIIDALSGEPEGDTHHVARTMHKLFSAMATIACELESQEQDDDTIDEAGQEIVSLCRLWGVEVSFSNTIELIVPNPAGGKETRVVFNYDISLEEVEPNDDGGEPAYEH